MGALSTELIEEIKARGNIRDSDCLALRRQFYDDGAISPAEAEALIALNSACNVQDPSWPDFFVEALTDYVVNQADPEGYITVENADWLIGAISHDGRVDTKTELELLINILERARWSPERLVSYAMQQVELAVTTAEGPLRSGQELTPGVIREAEVELLRRMVYAFAGEDNIAITKAEGELLFRINDALVDQSQNPAWSEFFVKAVANVVLAASAYKLPSREEALRHDAWLDERDGVAGFLKKMGSGMGEGFASFSLSDIYQPAGAEDKVLERLEQQRREIVTGEQITEDESEWLLDRLSRDGQLTENERLLIAYLKAEAPTFDAKLEELIERIGKAA